MNFIDSGVTFKDILNAGLITGGPKIAKGKYKKDANNNITGNMPVINAIDIDWNKAEIPGLNDPITSTGQLLALIGQFKNYIESNNETIFGLEAVIDELEEFQDNTSEQLLNILNDVALLKQANTNVYTKTESDNKYQNKGNYLTEHQSLDDYATKDFVDDKITDLVGATPETLSTLEKISNKLSNNDDVVTSITNTIAEKANSEDVYTKNEVDNKIDNVNDVIREYKETEADTFVDLYQKIKQNTNSTINHSIPIYDNIGLEKDLNRVINGTLINKENVILVPSKNEINQHTNKEFRYKDTGSNTYLDVLFNAIHTLQLEVARLKNSFNYGIQSETGTVTSTSKIITEEEADAEPLWAIDEDTLNPITTTNLLLPIGDNHILIPKDNVEIASSSLKVNNIAYLDYNLQLLLAEVEFVNKVFIYTTLSNLNVQIIMTNINNSEDKFIIDLSSFDIDYITSRYNIMICIGKSIASTDDHNIVTYEGYNFVWISIGDYTTGENLYTGYYNNNENSKSYKELLVGLSNDCKLENTYLPTQVIFNNLLIFKYDLYTQLDGSYSQGYQFIETIPTTNDFVYKAAHITIRGCKNYSEILSIKGQLLDRELIIDESTNKLYTKLNNKIIQISGGSSEIDNNTGMTTSELIELLEKNGIINITENGGNNIELNSIADITFIHQASGKKFKFEVNEEGNLHSTELSDFDEQTKSNIVKVLNNETSNYTNIRGFIGSLGNRTLYINDEDYNKLGDIGLYSDRLKIGAVYAPNPYQKVFGCSHAYIELENTSDKDICLNDFYMHYGYSTPDEPSTYKKVSLQLSGYIPAGGTYLIRGKQYADKNQANVNINVDNYDIEWYDGNKLIDLTWHIGCVQTYLLTYGIPDNFSTSTEMWGIKTEGNTKYRSFNSHFVDAIAINDCIKVNSKGTWYNNAWQIFKAPKKADNIHYYDVIFKNMFELDPAKQAFQGLACITTDSGTAGDKIYDSSRARHDKTTDYQYLVIEDDKISFPKSNIKYDISLFTPKASFEHKNVCTDKTQLDLDKPNMVTVSFGINMNRTRCFNWISAGLFDEYIWLRKKGTTEWKGNNVYKFESYHNSVTGLNEAQQPTEDSVPYRKSFGTYLNKFTNKYDSIESVIYDRITGIFPGCNIKYTSHKCVIELYDNDTHNVETWEYIVGRQNSDGTPNIEHSSEILEFTVYNNSYVPRIYQTTDQQGFHWIEYQVWTAAANEINKEISKQQEGENIVPILINTGDMTQNGTRINEWLDYYEGGKNLFNHIEQMNVVGNNDLCNTDPEILGTGDDTGKSNGFYFHVFYCYEIDPDILPIITNTNNDQGKYIPSFYYFGNGIYSFVMFNSELTVVNCRDWFKQIKNEQTVNIYTGFTMKDKIHSSDNDVVYDNSFTSVYTMLYNIFTKLQNNGTLSNTIVACHEMPFTVVTNANLTISQDIKKVDRSLSGSNTGSLVGSHCNVMNYYDAAGKGIYWFSRLMEYFNIKLVIGGHKHTYACTNPLRELYAYDNGTKFSNINGKMTMNQTLEHDDAIFKLYYNSTNKDLKTTAVSDYEEIHSSKFPIMKQIGSELGISDNSTVVFPYFAVNELNDGIVYAMCQATGYKLKSNKELPSANQKFSYIIPKTNNAATGDKPNIDQQYSMFTEIDLNPSVFNIYLYRIKNITKTAENNKESLFGQLEYSELDCKYEYMIHEKRDESTDIMYGKWVTTQQPMISVNH